MHFRKKFKKRKTIMTSHRELETDRRSNWSSSDKYWPIMWHISCLTVPTSYRLFVFYFHKINSSLSILLKLIWSPFQFDIVVEKEIFPFKKKHRTKKLANFYLHAIKKIKIKILWLIYVTVVHTCIVYLPLCARAVWIKLNFKLVIEFFVFGFTVIRSVEFSYHKIF